MTKQDKVAMSVRLERSLHHKLIERTKKERRSANATIVLLLEKALEAEK